MKYTTMKVEVEGLAAEPLFRNANLALAESKSLFVMIGEHSFKCEVSALSFHVGRRDRDSGDTYLKEPSQDRLLLELIPQDNL